MEIIYYKDQKICGQPIETETINFDNFNFLMECPKPQYEIEFGADENGEYIHWFRYVKFSNAGVTYSDSQYGTFYLPKAIIFYDEHNEPYGTILPKRFWFIAMINNKLEIRKVESDKDIKYWQIPELHKEVSDKNTIQKIENTLESAIDFLKEYQPPVENIPIVKGSLNICELFEKERQKADSEEDTFKKLLPTFKRIYNKAGFTGLFNSLKLLIKNKCTTQKSAEFLAECLFEISDEDDDFFILSDYVKEYLDLLAKQFPLSDKIKKCVNTAYEKASQEQLLRCVSVETVTILNNIFWNLSSDKFQSQTDFEKALKNYNEEISHKNFAIDLSENIINSPKIVVQYFSWNKKRDEEVEKDFTLQADNGQFFTIGELLYKVHNKTCKEMQEIDNHFFEGFELRIEENNSSKNNPRCFLLQGS